MLVIKPGEHGSTYGGNPLACKVAIAALKVCLTKIVSSFNFMLQLVMKGEILVSHNSNMMLQYSLMSEKREGTWG